MVGDKEVDGGVVSMLGEPVGILVGAVDGRILGDEVTALAVSVNLLLM